MSNPIIVEKTSEGSAPITLDDPSYSVGNDNGQNLMSRMSTAFIRKRGKSENNTGPTAQILKVLTAEPSWFQKTLTNLGITETGSTLYLCRIISDHRTSGCPEPVSVDDNITDLHFTRFILPGDAPIANGDPLGPGAIVRVRMDDNRTMFASDIAGTIDKIIDPTATIESFSQNCSTDIPKPGGDARTTVEGCSANTAGGGSSSRKIKIATTKPPRPTRGEFPKSPLTGKRAVDTDGTRTLSRDERKKKITGEKGNINSPFPARNEGGSPHKGIDLRTEKNGLITTGVPVKAALDGHAINGKIKGYGYVVAIKHTIYKAPTKNSAFWTFYAHLTKGTMISGKVSAGQQIALSGDSNGLDNFSKTTPHLHFEVIYENDPSWTTVGQVISGGAVDPIDDFFLNKFEKK